MAQTPITIIPNELCRRAGVASSWRSINEFSVFPSQKIVNRIDKLSDFAPTSSSVFNVHQDAILFKPILRKLVNEASGTFSSLQLLAASDEQAPDFLSISRQYRSIIRACLENLQEQFMKSSSIHREELQNYITVFYTIECVWHLCEILFIDRLPGSVVMPHLLDWIRFHCPKYEKDAAVMLSGELGGLEAYPNYWETVMGSMLQGRLKVVRALLRLHTNAETPAFKLADQCLRLLPIYDIFSGISAAEFDVQMSHWVADVQSKIDAKMFISCYDINLLMKLTVGDSIAWEEIQETCGTWYEILGAWLFYNQPTVKSFELGQFAKQFVSKMATGQRIKHLDRILLAAMDFDILKVIKEIQYMTESGWFVTHLTDLLFHTGRLNELNTDIEDFQSEKLRESFIIDYGSLLMGHKSLWQVGLNYLDYCLHDGYGIMKLLLPKIPIDSEKRAQKIICEANKRDLPHIAQSICKVQAMNCVRRGRLGHALTWAIKSNDGSFTTFLADKFLQQYILTGTFECTDLLDELGSSILISDRLLFLSKYYEFHKLYEDSKFADAAYVLVSLMESKIVPKFFWPTLLTDSMPLLEAEELVFSAADTSTIIQSLEDNVGCKDLEDKICLLRLAATRNLGRAHMYENQ